MTIPKKYKEFKAKVDKYLFKKAKKGFFESKQRNYEQRPDDIVAQLMHIEVQKLK